MRLQPPNCRLRLGMFSDIMYLHVAIVKPPYCQLSQRSKSTWWCCEVAMRGEFTGRRKFAFFSLFSFSLSVIFSFSLSVIFLKLYISVTWKFAFFSPVMQPPRPAGTLHATGRRHHQQEGSVGRGLGGERRGVSHVITREGHTCVSLAAVQRRILL